jgi:hypothetical protein
VTTIKPQAAPAVKPAVDPLMPTFRPIDHSRSDWCLLLELREKLNVLERLAGMEETSE